MPTSETMHSEEHRATHTLRLSLALTMIVICQSTLPVVRAKTAPKGHRHSNGAAHSNHTSQCEPLILPACKNLNLYPNNSVHLPNAFGHSTQHEVSRAFKKFAPMLKTPGCGEWLSVLLCLTYAPACPARTPACRQLCASAWAGCWEAMERAGMHWPHALDCETMPIGAEEDGRECVSRKGHLVNHTGIPATASPSPTKATPTQTPTPTPTPAKVKTIKPSTKVTKKPPNSKKPPKKTTQKNLKASKQKPSSVFTKAKSGEKSKNRTHIVTPKRPIHTHTTAIAKTVSSLPKTPIKRRRYDVIDIGDPQLFQGWADVQGQGAANDYCRVIGKAPKQRFLSCALAGGVGPDHVYVSKRGFDVGHRGSWFMRDMDKDGRDDYCRCVGRGSSSKIACMKAGKSGFYGSLPQPGNQFTFYVKSPTPCGGRAVNPVLGVGITTR